jgi:lipopolysaccharide export system permease protein
MHRLTLYLLRALALSTLVVTFAVTAAIWLTRTLRYIDVVVENGAPLHMFVWLMLLTLPTFIGLILPIAMFVAVLFTYNRLTSDTELIAMRACGVSPLQIARPALLMAGGLTALGFILSLWIQPIAMRELTRQQYFVQSQFSAALLKEGTFNDLGNKMSVYVAKREENGELKGILIYDARQLEKPITIRANNGQLVQGDYGPQVIVENGVQQEYDRKTKRLAELRFESYAVSLDSLVSNKEDRLAPPREKSTFGLMDEINAEQNPARRGLLIAELHQRFTSPWLTLAFTLVAACTLLLGEYSRRGQSWRIVLAVALTAGLQAGALAISQSVGKNLWLIGPLYISTFAPIAFMGYLLLSKSGGKAKELLT